VTAEPTHDGRAARVQRVDGLRRSPDGSVQVDGPYLAESGESPRLGGLYLAHDPAPPEGPLYILYRIESADTQRVVAVGRAREGIGPLASALESELRRGWLRPGPLARYTRDVLEAELARRKGGRPATDALPSALRRAPTRALQGELYRRGDHQRLEVAITESTGEGDQSSQRQLSS